MITHREKKHGFQGINVVRLRPRHVLNIEPQAEQADFMIDMPANWMEMLSWAGQSWAIKDKNNQIITICGAFPVDGEAVTWAVHSDLFKKHVIEVTSAVSDFLQNLASSGDYTKLVGFVRGPFTDGHRWMKALKFKLDMKCPEIDGQAVYERNV